jgi:hypothetical protein
MTIEGEVTAQDGSVLVVGKPAKGDWTVWPPNLLESGVVVLD